MDTIKKISVIFSFLVTCIMVAIMILSLEKIQ